MQPAQFYGNLNLLQNVSNLNLLSNTLSLSPMINPLNVFQLNPFNNPAQPDFYTTLMMLKSQSDYHAECLKSQIMQLARVQNQSLLSDIKMSSLALSQKEMPLVATPDEEKMSPIQLSDLCDANKSVKAHLKDIIYFVLENFGTLSEEQISAEKQKYRNHPELSLVFEALVCKYSTTVKSKEEVLQHIFKKAVKYMKLKLKKEAKNASPASTSPGKQHFRTFLDEMSGKIGECGDDDEIKPLAPLK